MALDQGEQPARPDGTFQLTHPTEGGDLAWAEQREAQPFLIANKLPARRVEILLRRYFSQSLPPGHPAEETKIAIQTIKLRGSTAPLVEILPPQTIQWVLARIAATQLAADPVATRQVLEFGPEAAAALVDTITQNARIALEQSGIRKLPTNPTLQEIARYFLGRESEIEAEGPSSIFTILKEGRAIVSVTTDSSRNLTSMIIRTQEELIVLKQNSLIRVKIDKSKQLPNQIFETHITKSGITINGMEEEAPYIMFKHASKSGNGFAAVLLDEPPAQVPEGWLCQNAKWEGRRLQVAELIKAHQKSLGCSKNIEDLTMTTRVHNGITIVAETTAKLDELQFAEMEVLNHLQ